MTQPISIKLNQLKTRKKVLIDDHEYTVRRMGNIEQIEYARGIKKLQTLALLEADRPLTDEESAEIDTVSKYLTSVFIDLFDDGGDQEKSRRLIGSLSDEEIALVLAQIFEEKQDGQTS